VALLHGKFPLFPLPQARDTFIRVLIDAFVKSVITSWKLKNTCLSEHRNGVYRNEIKAEVEARFDLIERAEEAMP